MILNRTKKASERYQIIDGPMGHHGEPESSPNHKYQIANGIDRGNGFQGYMSVTYFLDKCEYVPREAKDNCRKFLRQKGYTV